MLLFIQSSKSDFQDFIKKFFVLKEFVKLYLHLLVLFRAFAEYLAVATASIFWKQCESVDFYLFSIFLPGLAKTTKVPVYYKLFELVIWQYMTFVRPGLK